MTLRPVPTGPSATRSTRPLTVIQSDIAVTESGREACLAVVEVLLAQRHHLLALGFPDVHSMCVGLDEDAAKWAAHAEHQRRALLALRAELNPEGASPT